MTDIASIANAFLLVYAGLFPIVNPVGSAPIFLRLTQGAAADRPFLAGKVAVNSFLLLLGSLIVGSHLLEFFGITLPIVRVAGGMVVAAFGWQLLHAREELEDQRAATAHHSVDLALDVAEALFGDRREGAERVKVEKALVSLGGAIIVA